MLSSQFINWFYYLQSVSVEGNMKGALSTMYQEWVVDWELFCVNRIQWPWSRDVMGIVEETKQITAVTGCISCEAAAKITC